MDGSREVRFLSNIRSSAEIWVPVHESGPWRLEMLEISPEG